MNSSNFKNLKSDVFKNLKSYVFIILKSYVFLELGHSGDIYTNLILDIFTEIKRYLWGQPVQTEIEMCLNLS